MLTILAYCLRDQDIMLPLLEWINELGSCKKHDLFLIWDGRCEAELCNKILQSAKQTFSSVQDHVARAQIDDWPEGANYMFRTASSFASYKGAVQYWFWMEPDAIPVRPKWLDTIEAEYIAQRSKSGGKPFMGDRVEVEKIPLHMSGIGVYPNPLYDYAGEAHRAFDVAWDMAAKDQIVPKAFFTKLIEHAWRHPSFTMASELDTQIRKEAVLFHASKDGSLIKLLRQRKAGVAKLEDAQLHIVGSTDLIQQAVQEPVNPRAGSNPASCCAPLHFEKLPDSVAPRWFQMVASGERERPVAGESRDSSTGSRHEPLAATFPCDIFIRTYPQDYEWLYWCLSSIQKYCTGFRKVMVCSPAAPPEYWNDWKARYRNAGSWEWKVMNDEAEDGYLGQQIHKLYADVITDYQVDYILHIDSDTLFTRAVTPNDFFHDGKTIWPYTPYVHLQTPWQPITEKFLNEPVPNEFMRRFPIMIPRWLYPKVREFAYRMHKMIVSDYVRLQPQRAFSEFNVLGAYAFKYHKENFHWINTIEKPLGAPCARQFYSHGGITAEVRKEIDIILRGQEADSVAGSSSLSPATDSSWPQQSDWYKAVPSTLNPRVKVLPPRGDGIRRLLIPI